MPSTQKPHPSAAESGGSGPTDASGTRPGSAQMSSRPWVDTAAKAAGAGVPAQ